MLLSSPRVFHYLSLNSNYIQIVRSSTQLASICNYQYRSQNKGLVDVTPISSQEGLLKVSLESKDLDDNAGALRIQTDTEFLN